MDTPVVWRTAGETVVSQTHKIAPATRPARSAVLTIFPMLVRSFQGTAGTKVLLLVLSAHNYNTKGLPVVGLFLTALYLVGSTIQART